MPIPALTVEHAKASMSECDKYDGVGIGRKERDCKERRGAQISGNGRMGWYF